MCGSLFCRTSHLQTKCISIGAAAEGTTCGDNQICTQEVCTTASLAGSLSKIGTLQDTNSGSNVHCPFGDDVVTQELVGIQLKTAQMTCTAFLDFVFDANQSPSLYCSEEKFAKACCQTCKSVSSFLLKIYILTQT